METDDLSGNACVANEQRQTVVRCLPCVTRHTSHVTRHTSHVTRHTLKGRQHAYLCLYLLSTGQRRLWKNARNNFRQITHYRKPPRLISRVELARGQSDELADVSPAYKLIPCIRCMINYQNRQIRETSPAKRTHQVVVHGSWRGDRGLE